MGPRETGAHSGACRRGSDDPYHRSGGKADTAKVDGLALHPHHAGGVFIRHVGQQPLSLLDRQEALIGQADVEDLHAEPVSRFRIPNRHRPGGRIGAHRVRVIEQILIPLDRAAAGVPGLEGKSRAGVDLQSAGVILVQTVDDLISGD